MRYFIWLCIGLVGVASAAAPVSGPSDEQRFERLERRVDKITELTLQIDGLRQENRTLRGQIETLNHSIEQLKRKQRDMYLDVDQRFAAMQGMPAGSSAPAAATPTQAATPPSPNNAVLSQPVASAGKPVSAASTMTNQQQIKADYDAAYALLSPAQRRYKEAIQAFTTFLKKYPKAALAGNAQYWLGEAHYVSQDNAAALQAFEQVVSGYPGSSKVPGALYKIGRIHQVKKDLNAARTAFQRIVQDYPNSSAASLARERLTEMNRKR